MRNMKIWLDQGHGGNDSGAVGGKGTYEKNINLEVSNLLGKMLYGAGYTVGYTRTSDKTVGLSERARLANNWGAELFVSIHCNSYKDREANGVETYSFATGTKAYDVAKSVQKKLVQYLKIRDRGVKTANFAVLRETKMPAILVELAFISNAKEETLLSNADFREKAAIAIFEGITNMKYKTEIGEITSVNDLVWELAERGIITDKELWLKKLEEDSNSYWLARKTLNYIRERE